MTTAVKPTPPPRAPWRAGWELVIAASVIVVLPLGFLTVVGFASGESLLVLCGLISLIVVAGGARKEATPAKHVKAALIGLALTAPMVYFVVVTIIAEGFAGEDVLQALSVVTLTTVTTLSLILVLAIRRTRAAGQTRSAA